LTAQNRGAAGAVRDLSDDQEWRPVREPGDGAISAQHDAPARNWIDAIHHVFVLQA
jgi:hypothetical protein